MKRFLVLCYFLGWLGWISAQNVQFTAQAPKVVEAGEQFELVFSANGEPTEFLVPKMTDFRILFGPSTSQSSSTQWINGKVTSSSTYSYSYVLIVSKPGKYIIGSAEVTVGGKKYKSNPVTIEVIGSSSGASQQGNSSAGTGSGQDNTVSEKVSTDGDIFIRVIIDKKNVYLGEYLTASVKLYSKANISSIDNVTFPAFDGFFKQDIETPPIRSLERETVNGEIYGTGIIKKFILIPQKTGELKIEPMTMDLSIQQQVKNRRRSVFDDFFGPSVQNIPQKLKSKTISVNVKALPGGKPDSFNGAVGRFTMDAKTDKTTAKTNDAITLKVTISGTGNIKLLEAPKINFPPDFDSYDPKVNLNTGVADGGVSGSKTFEYLIVPRNPGEFRIAPLSFTYFDVNAGQYKTITSKEFVFNIEKGEQSQATTVVSGLSKEDVKYIGKDIFFIKTGDFGLSPLYESMYTNFWWYLIYIIGMVTFVAIVWVWRRNIKINSNMALVKNRRADKFATKRLKQAKIHLDARENEKFYEELLKGIWGYLSDKLNIPLSELSRENAREMLEKQNLAPEIIQDFLQLVDNCEYARYAPPSEDNAMQHDYDKAIDLMLKLQLKLR
jgi:hypothetical protein